MDQYLNDDDWRFIFNFLSDQKFMIRKILFYSPLLIIILLGILFYYSLNSETKSNSPLIGKQIPEFSIERLLNDNDQFSSKDLISSETINFINVWASWCIPCRAEHNVLELLSKIDNVDLYGINHKDTKKNATNFINTLGNPFREIGFDSDGRTSIEWGVFGVPETFIVHRGKIIYKHIGPIHISELEDTIIPIIKDLN